MPKLKTDQLKEGMLVVKDVKNIDDMLLIPTGCSLTERQINILQAWGVNEIEVQGPGVVENADPLTKLKPEQVERLTAELKKRFWKPDESSPVYVEIFKLVLRRRAQRISDNLKQ